MYKPFGATCMVRGCPQELRGRPYSFPKKLDLFMKWVQLCQNPSLYNLTLEEVRKRRMKVCGSHFAEEDFISFSKLRRLKDGVVPTLNMPSITQEQESIILEQDDEKEPEFITTFKEFFNQIDLPSRATDDLQMVEDHEILQNLNALDPKVIDVSDIVTPPIESNKTQRRLMPLKLVHMPLKLVHMPLPLKNEQDDKEDSNNGGEVEADSYQIQEAEFIDTNQIAEETDQTVETEAPPILIEKPYFKSVKSLSVGTNLIREVCRICFRALADGEIIKLYEETPTEDVIELKEMLKSVLPTLDLEIYPNTVLCTKCVELLAYSCQLQNLAAATEEKLTNIVLKKKGVTNRDADLIIVMNEENNDVSKSVDFDHDYGQKATPEVLLDLEKNIESIVLDNYVSEGTKTTNVYHIGPFSHDVNSSVCDAVVPTRKKSIKETFYGSGPYICDVCGKTFGTEERKPFMRHLTRHRVTKTKQRKDLSTVCEICGRTCKNRTALFQHSKTHVTHQCSICQKVFDINFKLQRHIKFVHQKLYRTMQCHVCGKKLNYRASLLKHLEVHNPSKCYQCHICNKTFRCRVNLKKHLLTHSEVRYECQICGKKLKKEWSLQKHIRTWHLGQADFMCQICGKAYWKKSDLISHKIKLHGISTTPKEK